MVVEPVKSNIQVTIGNETAVLQCKAFGALTYTWEKKDGTIPDKAMLREEGTILELPNIRRENVGDYRCVVDNNAGSSVSQYARVTVTGETKLLIVNIPLYILLWIAALYVSMCMCCI